MLHKFTATILSCLMLVVATTAQVGLNYCLCAQTVFAGDCPCALVAEEPVKDGCDSCSNCSEESTSEESIPCDDCNVTIDWELDQCVPQTGSSLKVASSFSIDADCLVGEILLLEATDRFTDSVKARGSPPPCLTSPTVPLYVRHSVFLI